MPMFPECAATPEDDGANFTPPTIGNLVKAETKRLREATAGNPFRRAMSEGFKFHRKMAEKAGVDSPVGLAHYKLARACASPGKKLQEFFENGGEIGELDPKAIVRANQDAAKFHKAQAEKKGLDTDEGHAHVAAMEHHLDIINKAKKQQASVSGYSGKRVPFPDVPKKSEMKNKDVHLPKPPIVVKKAAGEEAGSGSYVASRYDKSHPEGYVDPRYSDVKASKGFRGLRKSLESRRGVPKLEFESTFRGDDEEDGPVSRSVPYEPPQRGNGWGRGGGAYSPPQVSSLRESEPKAGVLIKEF